jgi:hypothetical protein
MASLPSGLGDREKPGAEREAATLNFSNPVTEGGIKKTKSRMIFEKRNVLPDEDVERDQPLTQKRSFARTLGDPCYECMLISFITHL